MRARRPDPMQISERELRSLTSDIEDAHSDSYPRMLSAVSDWREANGDSSAGGTPAARAFSRRGFLVKGGIAAAGGLILAACGSAGGSGSGSTTTTGPGSTTGPMMHHPSVDLEVAALAASLENLAVATYAAGIKAAVTGKLGPVPPAVANFAETAMAQHKDHGAGWNAILTSAGYKPVTAVDPVVQKIVADDFAMVHDVAGLASLALTLENVAAATYLSGLTAVSSRQAIATAASIQPVEMQHAAILNFVLGKYPVPMAFASTVGARPVSDYSALVKA
ncbi:MAG TPA: ferritin-like domain-containing protein [Acidimicrobiales bacterium]|nr:ferritin-like domain-containing protein [Acidimicrobiales bacterium]